MVGKTYLRYVVGPQGGCTVSNASLTVDSSVIQPQYRSNSESIYNAGNRSRGPRGGSVRNQHGGLYGESHNNKAATNAATVLFAPSLEAVRVLSVRSGAVLHTLIPAEAKMPLEVTSLRVCPLASSAGGHTGGSTSTGTGGDGVAGGSAASRGAQTDPHRSIQSDGWMLLVGYSNGFFAVFTCGATANYGRPVCRLFALGHKVDTSVLALATDPARVYACSAGQDTDVTVWDLIGQEALYRLRGHRGGVVALQFVPPRAAAGSASHGNAGRLTRGGVVGSKGNDDTLLVSAAADGLLKVWNLSLRQCIQTVVASDAQITSMVMDCDGRRLYCGVRENFIKVYSLDPPASTTSTISNNNSYSHSNDDEVLRDHGSVPRRYHKPITAFTFSPDWRFLLATTSRTVEVYRVFSSEEVKKRVYRRKRRAQRGGKNGETKGDNSSDGEAEGTKSAVDVDPTAKSPAKGKKRPRAQTAEADARGKNNTAQGDEEDADHDDQPLQTAAEEMTLLRTFFLIAQSAPNRKVRSACFVPVPPRGIGVAASDEEGLHIAVTFNNNSIQTYTTSLVLSDAVGGATWTLDDLKPRISFDQQGHQSDIRALAFVENDSALLSMSREKLLLWTLTVRESNLESSHTDAHDFYDTQEANLARIDFKGSLNCSGSVLLNVSASSAVGGGGGKNSGSGGESATNPAGAGDGVAMAAVSANLCCVGLSDGTIAVLDVASSETLFTDACAHVGGVKAVTKRPDDSGFLSVGADRRLVLWTVGLLQDNRSATLVLATELELTELPLFAAFSPDSHYLGVGLQNNNIQLFFADSLKPYLSLFGHKLPPTAISFSDDGTLAASVGTDKSLRFWGTDFGDCHRAIHAHDDYITAVSFVKNTHYVFTVSLDGSVKQWDGDNWTMIQFMRQHQHGLWAVAVTRNATCVATAGTDKCIRCFLRTQDIVFPEEEEERMGQEAMDEEAAKRAAMQRLDAAGDSRTGTDAALAEVGVAGQQTAATAEAAERIMAALDLVSVEWQRKANPEDLSPPHPLLASMTEWEYLWSIIASVRPSELRHALAALTAVHVDALLNFLEKMIDVRAVLDYEIAAKVVLGLVMPSAAAAAAGAGGAALALRTTAIRGDAAEVSGVRRLENLRRAISDGMDRSVARMDYNIAGLQFVCQYLQDAERVKFFDLSKIQGHKKKYHSRSLPMKKDS